MFADVVCCTPLFLIIYVTDPLTNLCKYRYDGGRIYAKSIRCIDS